MPLSDHEKRLLDEIEQTLRIDDPALASSLHSARALPRLRSLIAVATVALVGGTALLVVGLRLRDDIGTICGVLGFLAIMAGTDLTLRVTGRVRADRRASGGATRRWPRR